jgi:hypothetical protein
MAKKDLDVPEIPGKHSQMIGKRVPPRVERRILDAKPCHLVLEPPLEGMNFNLAAVGFSEHPVGSPLFMNEEGGEYEKRLNWRGKRPPPAGDF